MGFDISCFRHCAPAGLQSQRLRLQLESQESQFLSFSITVAAIMQALPGLGIALSGGDKDFYQLLEVPHLTAISPAYKRPLCSLQHSKHRYPGGALIRDPHDPHDPLG
jgi:hypothetical protein